MHDNPKSTLNTLNCAKEYSNPQLSFWSQSNNLVSDIQIRGVVTSGHIFDLSDLKVTLDLLGNSIRMNQVFKVILSMLNSNV